MTNNDKYALLIVLLSSIVFIIGLILQNTYLVVSSLVGILIGAGAYRGMK